MGETIALDYKFAKLMQEGQSQKVSAYEIGGGRQLADMLGVPLNSKSLVNSLIVITIDLSKPGNAVDSIIFWLNVVREQIEISNK
jgi:hypothetical protein